MLRRYAAVLILAGGCAAEAPAQTQRTIDRDLEQAGFVMRPADTPGKMKALQGLKPRGFTTRVRKGVRYYIYADPYDCKCAFVGYQQAFDSYRDMLKAPAPLPGMAGVTTPPPRAGLNEENLMVDEMNEDAGLWDGDDIFHLNFN
jgi:hypothetical protein